LTASDLKGFVETGFCLNLIVRRLLEQEFAFEAMYLCFIISLPSVFYIGSSLKILEKGE
jgi:hypothetical protein